MFSTLRKFIVIFLTLLQFIAPLVHAHASEYPSKPGLHVPGLEQYGAETKTLMARMQTMHYSVCADGIIVGVDTGLKQKRTNPQIDPDCDYFLHPQRFAFNPLVSRFETLFFQQAQVPLCLFFIPSPPPRAPPAR